MDYQMKIAILIDTEAKKNTVRDTVTSELNSAFAAGIVKQWTMDISGILVPAKDNEAYSEGLSP